MKMYLTDFIFMENDILLNIEPSIVAPQWDI